MKKFAFAMATMASAFTLGISSSANAASIVWTLSNVVYDDGATASGTFVTDSTTGLASAVNVSITAGLLSAFTYDSSNSTIFNNPFFTPDSFLALATGTTRYIHFAFANSLAAPGVNPLSIGIYPVRSSWDCDNCNNVRYAVSGFASAAAVPEPASWALMIAGFGLVGAATRRRPSVRVTYA